MPRTISSIQRFSRRVSMTMESGRRDYAGVSCHHCAALGSSYAHAQKRVVDPREQNQSRTDGGPGTEADFSIAISRPQSWTTDLSNSCWQPDDVMP
jgi:hypothetical protein